MIYFDFYCYPTDIKHTTMILSETGGLHSNKPHNKFNTWFSFTAQLQTMYFSLNGCWGAGVHVLNVYDKHIRNSHQMVRVFLRVSM